MSNPHDAACPDYAGEVFATERDTLTTAGLSPEAAITLLKGMWKKSNDAEIAQWDARLNAERIAAETAASNREQAQGAAVAASEQEAVDAEKEDKKKNKAKYLPVNFDRFAPKGRDVIPSATVLAKLKKGDHVPLYHFTNEGLENVEHNPNAESNNTARMITNADGSLSLEPVLSGKSVNHVKPDAELSIEQFSNSCPRLLKAMTDCGWPADRCKMFHTFWSNILDHPYKDSGKPRDQRALMMYQDKQRMKWHMAALAAAATGSDVYNLAPVCETKLAEYWREVDNSMRDAENKTWRETVRAYFFL